MCDRNERQSSSRKRSTCTYGSHVCKTYLSFLIEEEEIRTGLQEAYWVGRFEKLQSNPDIIIDGAHNPEGIESLVKTVKSHYKDKNVIVLFTALGDKQLHNMVGQLETIANEIILQHSPRSCYFSRRACIVCKERVKISFEN